VTVAPSPTTNYDRYREALLVACGQQPEQWSFKSDVRYQLVLEHVTHNQGLQFIDQIRAEYPTYWDGILAVLPEIVRENDRYGTPAVEPCDLLGFPCSPSNFRYLSQAMRLFTHAESLGLQAIHVLELGAGYGGLALYVYRLAHLFPSLFIAAYTTVDLPDAATVQSRMAAALNVPIVSVNGLDEMAIAWALKRSQASRFLFSAYAFSEFDADTRAWYVEHLVRHCDHGVVIWNFVNGVVGLDPKILGGPVYQFIDKPLKVERDRPAMYPESIKLVTF
jgi:hypothetical protein